MKVSTSFFARQSSPISRFLVPVLSLVLLLGFSLPASALDVSGSTTSAVDLVAYLHSHVDDTLPDNPDPSIEKYNRAAHFGTWAHQDSTRPCTNTREAVLERDADPSVGVKFKAPRNCVVVSGLWHDPYTGSDFENATDVQIDHVVPLKAAYYAGAYAWQPSVRCHYANYLGNNFHLLAVSGHENMAKGDRAPDDYMPPSRAYQCQYVNIWMKIKAIWKLNASTSEIKGIEDVMIRNHCDASFGQISQAELTSERAKAAKPIAACVRFETDLHKLGLRTALAGLANSSNE